MARDGTTARERRAVEQKKIAKFRPTHGRSRGGEGRTPKEDLTKSEPPPDADLDRKPGMTVATELPIAAGPILLNLGYDMVCSYLESRPKRNDPQAGSGEQQRPE
ncbi:MAG: hypothetical protein AMXMBFR33_17670 [Candidatus Xenobia bacterium]